MTGPRIVGREQPPVGAVPRGQIGRRARLDDPPAIDDGDDVGDRHEPETMRHDQHRPVAPEPLDRVADEGLARRIEMRRRLVEDDQPRTGEERASQGDALALAATEPCPVLPDRCLVPARQRGDERVGARFPGGLAQRLVRCVRSREPDVVRDAAVEEVRPLRDPRDVRAPRREVDRCERDPADEDRTRVRLDEAKEEVGGGRLAGAGGPDEGDDPALRDDQVEPVEGGRRPARIGDGHAGECDIGRGRDRDARTGSGPDAPLRGTAPPGTGSSRTAKTLSATVRPAAPE